MKNTVALVCGILFGVGLTVSQMTNPEKVIGFLDIFGQWDPTLVMVMVGGLLVTFFGYRWTFKAEKPVYADDFNVPGNSTIDRPLVIGSVLFGIGWGLSGYCPGPAIANLVINTSEAVYFIGSMLIGFIIAQILNKNNNKV